MGGIAIGLFALLPLSSTQAADVAGVPADRLTLAQARAQVYREALERITPSVVTIETVGGTQPVAIAPQRPGRGPGDPFGPPGPNPTGSRFLVAEGPTTGLIYSADGLILTSSFNFVRNPSVITVTLADGRRFVGELLARDEVRRLAMLRIKTDAGTASGRADNLPTPVWVDSPGDVHVGQTALAVGQGFGGSSQGAGGERLPVLSAGIISGLSRQQGLAIQTDAKLSPANFGGPLIDLQGRVLGICVPMALGAMFGDQVAGVEWYDSGIGFAVPAWQVTESARNLAEGYTLRGGMLGVGIDRLFERAVRISAIPDPSPAGRAGMEAGDIIIAVDGQPITSYADLRRLLAARFAGQRVTVRIRRGTRELDLPVVLAVPEDIGSLPQPPEEERPGTGLPEGEPPEELPSLPR